MLLPNGKINWEKKEKTVFNKTSSSNELCHDILCLEIEGNLDKSLGKPPTKNTRG